LITPNDSADLPYATAGIYIGGAGALTIIDMSGNQTTTPSLNSGWHPLNVKRVKSTGTTATGIMGIA